MKEIRRQLEEIFGVIGYDLHINGHRLSFNIFSGTHLNEIKQLEKLAGTDDIYINIEDDGYGSYNIVVDVWFD